MKNTDSNDHPYRVGIMERERLNVKRNECDAAFDSESDRKECYEKVKKASLKR